MRTKFSIVARASLCFISLAFLIFTTMPALGTTVNVPGTSDPWLAGMPNGTTASFNPGSGEPADVAPAESPVLATGITLSGGTILMWSATGTVGHPGDPAAPDGATSIITTHFTGAEHGISDINVPIDSLLGVFLGPGQPDSNPAPSTLDFSTAASRDYLTLSPALQQVFFMGDGSTSGAGAQMIVAPVGATRLFLGTMDGFSWNNNNGSFEVTLSAVPEPTISFLLGASLLGLVGFRRVVRK